MTTATSTKTIVSFNRAAQRIVATGKYLTQAAQGAQRAIGEEIMTDIKASSPGHGVPVDDGILRGTGRVDGPNSQGDVELSFGGPTAPYAIVQHERVDFHHTVGEARYLVRGMERWRPGKSAAVRAMRVNMQAGLRRGKS